MTIKDRDDLIGESLVLALDATDRYLASQSPVIAHSPSLAAFSLRMAIAEATAACAANAESMGVR